MNKDFAFSVRSMTHLKRHRMKMTHDSHLSGTIQLTYYIPKDFYILFHSGFKKPSEPEQNIMMPTRHGVSEDKQVTAC